MRLPAGIPPNAASSLCSSSIQAHRPRLSYGIALSFTILLLLFVLLIPDTCRAESLTPQNDLTIDLTSEPYRALFTELREKHHFSQQELDGYFTGLEANPEILKRINQQWESRPLYLYLALLFTPAIINGGQTKLEEHSLLLDQIEEQFGVDREYIIAIWAIETRFGQNQGKYEVFRSLNTLFSHYPRRAAFFRKQLIHLLLLCRENNIPVRSIRGSYAGAFGQTQFIPSSFREYAVSFDGDNQRDVFDSIPDILASIANYLHRHHWALDAPVYAEIGNALHSEKLTSAFEKGNKGRVPWREIARIQAVQLERPPEDAPLSIIGFEISPLLGGGTRYIAGYPNFHAITAWNHSNRYAMAVCQLAQALARAVPEDTP